MSLQNREELAKRLEYIGISEIIPDRFYFVTFKDNTPNDSEEVHYFTTGNDTKERLNLATISRFLKKVNTKLSCPDLASKSIVYSTSGSIRKRYNAAISVGAYAIVYLKMNPKEISEKLTQHTSISPLDYINGINIGVQLGFVNFDDFNEDAFEMLDKIKLNWIVPGKLLKFTGPLHADQKNYLKPKNYLEYFRESGVSAVVRVNHMKYDASPFVNTEFNHYDLTVTECLPSESEVDCFLDICETSEGAVVVQNRAELVVGRTSCLFGAYLMKHYRLKAAEAMAWQQLCRSDSTEEQSVRKLEKEAKSESPTSEVHSAWSKKTEDHLSKLGKKCRVKSIQEVPCHKYGICSVTGLGTVDDLKQQLNVTETPSEDFGSEESLNECEPIIEEEKTSIKEVPCHKYGICIVTGLGTVDDLKQQLNGTETPSEDFGSEESVNECEPIIEEEKTSIKEDGKALL